MADQIKKIPWNKGTVGLCKPNSGNFKKGYIPFNKKEYIMRENSRRREFGHMNLNEWFKNSEAHHIDLNTIIYIPKEIHRMIRHNIKSNKSMEIINTYAYFFLIQNNIDKLSGVI